jgi:predicted Zn-dependent protease with MMP-like domain
LAFEIDLRKLENDYSIMSATDFARLRRSDLTPEAAELYDRVAAIRKMGNDSALEVAPVGSDTSRANPALIQEATGSETFEDIVEWAYTTLPQMIKDLPDFPGIQVVDEPPEGYLEGIKPRPHDGPLGMFLGMPRNKREYQNLQRTPDLIFIFQGPLIRYSKRDQRDLRSQVKQTVWHEVAHWLGYDEEDVRELGL